MNFPFRRICSVLLAGSVFLLCIPVASAEVALNGISADAAVLIAADTGSILYEKEKDKQLPMASTTKIMTTLLTLEKADEEGDPVVSITDEMVRVEGSSMGLQAGDELPMSGLAAGMMMASGNDAANAAALALAGSKEEFAVLMNQRAEELKMENSHFVTPSGLDDEAHYSTAYDMALLTREALKNERFRELASSRSCQVTFQNPEKTVQYTNHNKLLWMYEGCIGVKTGFTKKSGRCLISAAQREGVTLIAVTLNAPDDWNDHMRMFDYGFSVMESISFDESGFSIDLPLAGGDKERVRIEGAYGGSLSLPREDAERIIRRVLLPRFLYAPIAEGETVGKVQYYLDDVPVFSVPLAVSEAVAAHQEEESLLKRFFG